jgi:tRNA-2-methylthio-N6-dimethylallyladenosine synthase
MASIHDVPGLSRIRALTSYPPDMTDRILEGMAELPKVCEAYSLPVQSGDDEILTKMRRGYNIKEFVNRVEKVRHLMPDAGISTDIIVGSPGETDAQFQNTLKLITELRFDKVHVATYSERPGTFAARFQPDDVSATEKHDRLQAIEETQRKIALEINQNLMGKVVEVLVEHSKSVNTSKENRLTGRTRSNKLVHFNGPAETTKIGMMVMVKITTTGAWSLQGQQVPSPINVRN